METALSFVLLRVCAGDNSRSVVTAGANAPRRGALASSCVISCVTQEELGALLVLQQDRKRVCSCSPQQTFACGSLEDQVAGPQPHWCLGILSDLVSKGAPGWVTVLGQEASKEQAADAEIPQTSLWCPGCSDMHAGCVSLFLALLGIF